MEVYRSLENNLPFPKGGLLKPMLSSSGSLENLKLPSTPCIAQLKLDGIRLILRKKEILFLVGLETVL